MKFYLYLVMAIGIAMPTRAYPQLWAIETLRSNLEGAWTRSGDFDQDGDPDILVQSGDTVFWFENLQPGWYPHIIDTTFYNSDFSYVDVLDLDGDGDLDVLKVATNSNLIDTLSWNENQSGGSAWVKHNIMIPDGDVGWMDNSYGDIDGDGDLDIVVPELDYINIPSMGGLSWLENPGNSGAWTKHYIRSGSHRFSSVADMDNDGDLDIVASNNTIFWLENNLASGGGWSYNSIASSSSGAFLFGTTSDINGDGSPDVVSSFPYRLAYFSNNNPIWQMTTVNPTSYLYFGKIGDIDGDGDNDITYGGTGYPSTSRALGWAENDSNGTHWTLHDITPPRPVQMIPTGLEDIDGDGDLDIISLTFDGNTFRGSAFWAANPLYKAGPSYITYVDSSATQGLNNGRSWVNAYTDLQTALANTDSGEIWVAKGTYYPSPDSTDRDAHFYLKNEVAIYGGFAGVETLRVDRDWSLNLTILSGDIDRNDLASPANTVADIAGGNSYHIFSNPSGLDTTAVLDGFILTAGLANTPHDTANYGAALFNDGGNQGFCNPKIENCQFLANRSASYGGALANSARRNGGSFPLIRDCEFRNNLAEKGGGALYYTAEFGGELGGTVAACTFENNRSDSVGGALFMLATTSGNAAVSFRNSTFYDNESGNEGGAAKSEARGNSILRNQFFQCHFENNRSGLVANQSGGAFYSIATIGSTDNTGFFFCKFIRNQANNTGGAIRLQAGSQGQSYVQLDSCVFDHNFASVFGGAIYSWADQGVIAPQISRSLFTNNSANRHGGAMSNDCSSGGVSKAVISDTRFEGNRSGLVGPSGALVAGALYSSGSNTGVDSIEVLRCVFLNNTTVSGGAVFLNGGFGGSTFARVDSCSFQENGASSTAGAIFIQGHEGSSYTRITRCAFQRNISQGTSGAIYLSGSDGPDANIISNCSFTENQCNTIGGAIYNLSTEGGLHTQILNCDFISNKSGITGSSGSLVAGGVYSAGIYGGSDSSVIRGCHFFSNNSSSAGALFLNAVEGQSHTQIDSCRFTNNRANTGYAGAVYCQGARGVMNPVFSRCEFSGNEAPSSGGAVFLTATSGNANPTFSECLFKENEAYAGGGLFANLTSNGQGVIKLHHTQFTGNSSFTEGGAIRLFSSASSLRGEASNMLFNGNGAGTTGGAIALQGIGGTVTLRVESSTFYHNNSDSLNGSAIYSQEYSLGIARPLVVNSVFTDHGNGTPVWPLAQSTVLSSFVDNGYTGNGNLSLQDGNPAFADPDGPDNTAGTEDDNLSLLPQSILINAGDTLAMQLPFPTDLAGNPRVQLGTLDMGAYESDSLVNTTALDLGINPSPLRIWPNPAKEVLWLEFLEPGVQPAEISIWDLSGKCLLKYPSTLRDKLSIPVDGFPAGMYLLQVRTSQQRFSRRFIVK